MHQQNQENKVLCTLPGIWKEIEPDLFKTEYNAGVAWIEARLNELTVHLTAKAHVNMGGVMMAVITLKELHATADNKEAIERRISLLENTISYFLKEKNNQAGSVILSWLVAYGVGGCWSGYTDATIIRATSKEEATEMAYEICLKETAKQCGNRRGASFDIELIETDVKDTALWCSRLKPSAQALLIFELKKQ